MPRNPSCTRCPLHVGVHSVCIPGTGARNARIMLIGEGPGEQEDLAEKPFVGAAGRVLDQALAKAGLRREEVWTTNLVRCRPPSNRAPTKEEARACFSYLAEEIEAVQPRVIIALGGSALKLLTGRDSVARARGSFLEPAKGVRVGEAKVLGTYHPAAYLHSRNPMMLQGLIEDLTFAAQVVKDGGRRRGGLPLHEATLLAPGYGAEELEKALAGLEGARVLALDCEWTYATDRRMCWPWTRGAELFSLSISGRVGETVQSVALALPLGKAQREVLCTALRGKKCIFHNAIADLIWLYDLKLPITLSGDTMLLAHLFNETAELKLATLAEVWVGIENWKQPLWDRRPVTQEGWDSMLAYNAADTMATLLVMEKLYEKLHAVSEAERVSITRLYTQLSLPCVLLFTRMALRGMPLSLGKVQAAIREHEERERQYGEELGSETRRKVEQALELANSPAQVKRLLRESYGIEADTTNAAAMDSLAEQYPICALIQKVKHEGKLLGTYLRPWEELLTEQGDGRLHSVYSITRTVTGRTSAQTEKGASLQLVPRKRSNFGDEAWLRAMFEAPEGFELGSADYAQLEMRIAAIVAGERTLLRLFREGYDPHTFLASKIVGCSLAEVTTKQRQDAKPGNFGFLYGMGADKFTVGAKKDYGITFSLPQAQEIRNLFFATYPDFQPWYRRCEAQFQKGFVKTLFGRYRRNLPDSNKVANTLVQTPATELTMLALIEIDRWLEAHPELESSLVGFVHDDGKILWPADERGEQVRAKVAEIMEHPPTWKLGVEDLGVPLEAEITAGPHW